MRMRQVIKHREIKLLKMIRRTDPVIREEREEGRLPSAVAFGAALSVGAVRAGVRRARGISDGSESPDSNAEYLSAPEIIA